jgi:hypothetical protein
MNEQQIRATALDAALRLGFTANDPELDTATALYRVVNVAEWLADWITSGETGDLTDLPWTGPNDKH